LDAKEASGYDSKFPENHPPVDTKTIPFLVMWQGLVTTTDDLAAGS
jgi:hypothetical protein